MPAHLEPTTVPQPRTPAGAARPEEGTEAPVSPVLGRIQLCGEPTFSARGAQPIQIEPRDALLLAYLALEGPTPRARLATLLWPETDRERARTSLRQRHFRLRRLLGFDPLRQGETTALVAGLLTDLGPGDPEDAATDFAPLLGSFEWSGSGEAGAWLARARADQAAQRLDALRAAAAEHEAQGRLAAAICVAQRLLAADALSEHAHRRLMRLHYLRGDRAAAIAAFEHCERVLKDELGTPPGAETLSLLRTVETSGSDMAVLPRGFVPVSVLRPPRLVGRDQELRRLALAWESDQAFCLIGEAGMGKSRLLAEFAASRGDVVCVQARPGDAAIPYAMMARTLRAVRAHADGTETTAPAGALVALLPELAVPGTPDGAPDRHALQQAIERLLAGARGRGLGGVLIDDLHFADEPSVSMLSTLIGFDNLGGLSLGMARRPSETAPAALALSDAGAETRCVTEVNLAPLDAAQLAELLASLDLPGLDVTHWVPLLARHTGGNPLFALETIKALTLETTGFRPGAGRLPIPSTIGALIAQRLKRLSSEALALARVAAVAGIDFCSALAEDVLEARAVDLASPWVELESAYVLRDEKFAHDLVYDAVLATIPPAVARRMHGAVAQYLEHHPGEPARVAEHWLGAGRAPAAVPWLERAAQDALKAFERPAAAGFLEAASRIEADAGRPDSAFRLQASAIRLLQGFDSGTRHDAATLRLIEMAHAPEAQAEAQTLRAVFLHIVNRPTESLAAVEQGERFAVLVHDDAVMARLLNMRGIVLRRLGRVGEARVAHERGIEIERRLGLQADLAASLNNLALALMELDEHAPAVPTFEESARLQHDLPTRARVLNNMSISLEETGGAMAALKTRQNALALLVGQEGVAAIRLNITHSLGANARQLLRFDEALRWLDQADDMSREVHHWRAEDLVLQRALLLTELGQWSAADDLLSRVEGEAQPVGALRMGRLLARARYKLRRRIDAGDVLAEAARILPTIDERRTTRRLHSLQLKALAPQAALELARREIALEAARGNEGSQIAFLVGAANASLQLGCVAEAQAFSERATAMLDRVWPVEFSPFDALLTHLEVLQATHHPDRSLAAGEVATKLLRIAADQVPEPYRGGFLRGHPTHRTILRLAGMERLLPGA